MTIVRRPSPFGELLSLRSAMDRLFEDSFVRPHSSAGLADRGSGLPLDVSASSDEIRVEASLPGFRPEDVEITVEDDTLSIAGHMNDERTRETGDYLLQEIRRGDFRRTVSLPNGLEPDKASATFENGVLTLRIPRAEQVKPRHIRITPTTDDARPGVEREPANAGA
jgi:HSP20 family protein